ncbi:hypothetical protein [Armatimonas rosea]|uniref:Uncharacterized protein n=1 Tax=Armatimonas rosea TaxID=685828 RepID=A0A7W9SWZ0_ARMRO|nr:hypothetical protein [Armatimonas rosea]MBB6053948.1 hypothetical protein [Armatimonas rosea]
MGRRPKAATEGTEATAEAVAAPIVRRRRRSTTVDHNAQGQILIESLLKSRGERGATQEEALAVVTWARGVHAEAAELKALTTRVRRAKTENAAERQIALGVNQALLDGVLSGALAIDVNEVGAITFRAA